MKKKMSTKSHGLSRAEPGPSRDWRLWLGPVFEKAKAGAFRPSRAGTTLFGPVSSSLVLPWAFSEMPVVVCMGGGHDTSLDMSTVVVVDGAGGGHVGHVESGMAVTVGVTW
jgi:hypothetical protein